MAIMSKEKNTENTRMKEIDVTEEEENQKMEMFFNLIRNYQEAKKRRRQELTQDYSDVSKKRSNGGERSGIVPVFRAEDFSYCMDLNLKPTNSIIPRKNQEEEKEKDEEESEKVEKETREDNGLDLNLAL